MSSLSSERASSSWMENESGVGAHIRYPEWPRCHRPWLERYAVIHEYVPILGRVRVFPAVVAEAVPRIEQTVMGKRDRDARREVADGVLPAEPVGDEADFATERLFVASKHAPSGAHETDLDRVVFFGEDAVRPDRKSGAIVARFHLLTEVGVNVGPRQLS